MKMKLWFIIVLLLCSFLVSCNNIKTTSEEDKSISETVVKEIDFNTLFSSPVTKIEISASGKSKQFADTSTINELMELIKGMDFVLSENADMNTPGACTVKADVIMGSSSVKITFPMFLYNGRVYCTTANSIQAFYKYLD